MMMNTKKLLKMAKKWQQRAAFSRKRISLQTSSATTSSSTTVEKGCFVVYTADKIRFAFPISYLRNSVVQELLKISEEEFGLPTEGPITVPFDSAFLEYLIKLMDGDTEKALLMSISSARCSSQCSLQLQEQQSITTQQLLVF
ncbi:Small auxin-up RNA [Arabidopsis suecica]|uniref:Small auxin-up RNA n=1 Tax=Arabidopsis suecica TaxID=45249 RepID=A0A8T2CGL4_ARASU|nr:Small auxin-up RNA [Arabidopsis suecica]